MDVTFKLDRAGIREALKSQQLRQGTNTLARTVANNVEGQGHKVDHGRDALPVEVEPYTTDRAATSVTIAHPAGAAIQVKHGALTRAAAAAGLEVKSK